MSWAKVPVAAKHFGVSVRSFRDLLKDFDFPCSRLPSGTILVELEAGDEWLRNRADSIQDKQIISEILEGLKR